MDDVKIIQDTGSSSNVETALLGTIQGDAAGKTLVLANWNYKPVDPSGINCCVVEVTSSPTAASWRVVQDFEVWGTAIARLSATQILIGTADGDIISVQNGIAQTFTANLSGGVGSIFAIGATECWLTHTGGISYWSGNIATTVPLDVGDVHGVDFIDRSYGVAVGDAGAVIQFDGNQWNVVDSTPTNARLLSVFCASRDEIYICGWNGVAFHWDGKDKWEEILMVDNGTVLTGHIYNVIGYGKDIYLCAGKLGLFKISGKKAMKFQDFYCSRASVIDGNLVLTGLTNFIEFDGQVWRHTGIKLP